MSRFKVGDRVKIVGSLTACARNNQGYMGLVTKVNGHQWDCNLEKQKESGNTYYLIDGSKDVWENDIELIRPASSFSMEYKTTPAGRDWIYETYLDEASESAWYLFDSTINKKTFMENIVSFAKNLTLSADEKLLREAGLKNSCGDYTSEARELVLQKLIKDNEAYLIEVATAAKVANKN